MDSGVGLEWQVTPGAERAYLALAGELDMAAPEALDRALDAVADDVAAVTIDLTRVTFLDGAGLDALMDFTQRLADRGACTFFGSSPKAVSRYLELTGTSLR